MHSFHPGLDRLCQVSKPTATTPCEENKLLVSPGWLWRNCGSPSLVAQCILVSSIKVDVFGLRGSKKIDPAWPFSSGSHSANLICLVRAEPPSPQCSKLFPNSQASWNAAKDFPRKSESWKSSRGDEGCHLKSGASMISISDLSDLRG